MSTNGDAPAYPPSVSVGPSGDVYESAWTGATGLTKREAFAMAALTGLTRDTTEDITTNRVKLIAISAVELADATLAELSKPRNTK